MSTRVEILRAIGAHATWRDELAEAVKTGLYPQAHGLVADDSRCAVGRWLRAAVLPAAELRYRDTVTQLHAAFHLEAAKVLALGLEGHRLQAEEALAENSSFMQASRALTRAMKDWMSALPHQAPGSL